MDNQRKNKSRRGTTIVETAIVLPLLLILSFGIIKYGWLFLKSQQITNAARQVARVAIRPDDRSSEASAMFTALMDNAGITGAVLTVTPDYEFQSAGGIVTVKVVVDTAKVDILKLEGPYLGLPAPAELGAEVIMSKEGQVAN